MPGSVGGVEQLFKPAGGRTDVPGVLTSCRPSHRRPRYAVPTILCLHIVLGIKQVSASALPLFDSLMRPQVLTFGRMYALLQATRTQLNKTAITLVGSR